MPAPAKPEPLTQKQIAPVLEFMKKRHAIYIRRSHGESSPWTKDPILQEFKFTNVYRELDRVTQWVVKNISEPFEDNKNLWFMLCIARQINWPETLMELMADRRSAWPVGKSWSPARVREIMLARAARGDKVYTGAYLLNAQLGNLHGADTPRDKAYFTCNITLAPLWVARREVEPLMYSGLRGAAERLSREHGWGPFLAAQVVADLKFTHYLGAAEDWWTWAAPGPGSIRGLNRVLGRPLHSRLPADKWLATVNVMRELINRAWMYGPLCAQNMQNVLCEFDKYTRAKLGEGRPRARYKGANDATDCA